MKTYHFVIYKRINENRDDKTLVYAKLISMHSIGGRPERRIFDVMHDIRKIQHMPKDHTEYEIVIYDNTQNVIGMLRTDDIDSLQKYPVITYQEA